MKESSYYYKVKSFNERDDYIFDVNAGKLILNYVVRKEKKITIVGTGLGKDIEIVKNLKNIKIIGIEPRIEFQQRSSKIFENLQGKLYKMDLGSFVKNSKEKISGVFLFVHSINHIPHEQLRLFSKSLKKKSHIIIINPNPEIGKILGKLDDTVVSYLDSERIQELLKCKIVYDLFYHEEELKGRKIFLREIILLSKM